MPRGSTGTRSARPAVPGLTDSDLVSLYNVASTRSLSPGECPHTRGRRDRRLLHRGRGLARAARDGERRASGPRRHRQGRVLRPTRRGPPGPGPVWVGGARAHHRTGARRFRLRVAADGHPADAWPPGRIHGGAALRRARAPPRRPGRPRRRSRVTREGAHRAREPGARVPGAASGPAQDPSVARLCRRHRDEAPGRAHARRRGRGVDQEQSLTGEPRAEARQLRALRPGEGGVRLLPRGPAARHERRVPAHPRERRRERDLRPAGCRRDPGKGVPDLAARVRDRAVLRARSIRSPPRPSDSCTISATAWRCSSARPGPRWRRWSIPSTRPRWVPPCSRPGACPSASTAWSSGRISLGSCCPRSWTRTRRRSACSTSPERAMSSCSAAARQ